jgi:uncharacterized protein
MGGGERELTVEQVTRILEAVKTVAVLIVAVGGDGHGAFSKELLSDLFVERFGGSSRGESAKEGPIHLSCSL